MSEIFSNETINPQNKNNLVLLLYFFLIIIETIGLTYDKSINPISFYRFCFNTKKKPVNFLQHFGFLKERLCDVSIVKCQKLMMTFDKLTLVMVHVRVFKDSLHPI